MFFLVKSRCEQFWINFSCVEKFLSFVFNCAKYGNLRFLKWFEFCQMWLQAETKLAAVGTENFISALLSSLVWFFYHNVRISTILVRFFFFYVICLGKIWLFCNCFIIQAWLSNLKLLKCGSLLLTWFFLSIFLNLFCICSSLNIFPNRNLSSLFSCLYFAGGP